ncbi:hypothetical protein ACJMK2_022550 [Sinanodonta woodiana]|uniref:Angiotensin-converting enzyme n=1 Tax=Sinanodonta woodiana TaxID=1069815 RepID=A0ABD3TLD4_SINWO
MAMWIHLTLMMLILVSASLSQTVNLEEVNAYLDEYDKLAADLYYHSSEASWNYYTNITDDTLNNMTDWSLKESAFANIEAKNASRFNLSQIPDQNITRLLKKVMDIGISAFPDTDKLRKISEIQAEMTSIYSTAKGCIDATTCLPLEPDLTDIISNSRNYDKLKAAWKGWRDASGKKMKHLYPQYIQLLNEAITYEKKYADMGDYYRSWYESDTFENDVRALFVELAPLYKNLHAYVRRKLREHYGNDNFPTTGHIPAHILGNMWAQQWNNIYDLVAPYPEKESANITKAMIDRKYNVTYMYQVAEEFFTSIGLYEMPSLFWEKSMLVKPDGREVVCHASAWDFSNGRDFRIKQCTSITEDQLLTVHHEMGHIEYFLAYKDLPLLYRGGANPGFHEGVADIVTLSFLTPEHLNKIGLLDAVPGPDDTEGDINFLFRMALEKVAFLPFGYLIDQWRWSVFRGETTPAKYNEKWWDLRCEFQGINPPVERTNDDFDPGAKYHIPGGVPYISEMLKMGASRPWGEAMSKITNGTDDKLSALPLLEYFKPLVDWLEKNNKQYNETVGWDLNKCPNFLSSNVLSGSSITKSMGFIIGAMLVLCSIVISNVNN